MSKLRDNARCQFQERFLRPPEHIAMAPARVNLIGEHTDYNEGLALPVAINRHVVVAVATRSDGRVRAGSAAEQTIEFELGDLPAPVGHGEGSSFAAFIQGATEVFRAEAALGSGFDLWVEGNVPIGSGLSSSAALLVSLLLALSAHGRHSLAEFRLAEMARQVENEYLDLPSGLLDPLASRICRADHALFIDFRSLEHRHVPLAAGPTCWLLADTGVRRHLSESGYDQRVKECRRGWGAVRGGHAELGHMRELTTAHLDRLKSDDAVASRRLRHYITENERVLQMVQALARGDWDRAGSLLLESHLSLSRDYEVSCPELDLLVDSARDVSGWKGARMIGGGFGGFTLHLVESSARDELIATLRQRYRDQTGMEPAFVRFEPVDGAEVVPAGGM